MQPRLLTNSCESLRAAALAGLGLAAVPEWLVADALVAGQLTRVLAGHEPPSGGIYAVYPTNRLLTPTRARLRRPPRARPARREDLPR